MVISGSVKEDGRRELERLYKEFRELSFPPAHDGREIGQLHEELILYDADVAAAVARILKTSRPNPALRELTGLQENPKLQHLIDRFVTTFSSETKIGEVAREYENYYDAIKKMLQAARSYLDSSNR